MRKKLSGACLLAALTVLCAGAAAAQKADFSGTWSLDKSRSEGLPPDMDQTMTVKQSGDQLEVVTKVTGAQGEREVRDRYVLDGKEAEFVPPLLNGGGPPPKGTRVSKWAEDGAGFDANEKAGVEGPDGPEQIKAQRRWRLSPDGKSLTIDLTFEGPQGPTKTKRVFVRK